MGMWYQRLDRWLRWSECKLLGEVESDVSGHVYKFAVTPWGDTVMTNDPGDEDDDMWPVPPKPKKPAVAYDETIGEMTQAGWDYLSQKDEYDCWMACKRQAKQRA